MEMMPHISIKITSDLISIPHFNELAYFPRPDIEGN